MKDRMRAIFTRNKNLEKKPIISPPPERKKPDPPKPKEEPIPVKVELPVEEEKEPAGPKMIDAATQTEKIDFQRARAKFVMNKYGMSNLSKYTGNMSPHPKTRAGTSYTPAENRDSPRTRSKYQFSTPGTQKPLPASSRGIYIYIYIYIYI